MFNHILCPIQEFSLFLYKAGRFKMHLSVICSFLHLYSQKWCTYLYLLQCLHVWLHSILQYLHVWLHSIWVHYNELDLTLVVFTKVMYLPLPTTMSTCVLHSISVHYIELDLTREVCTKVMYIPIPTTMSTCMASFYMSTLQWAWA